VYTYAIFVSVVKYIKEDIADALRRGHIDGEASWLMLMERRRIDGRTDGRTDESQHRLMSPT